MFNRGTLSLKIGQLILDHSIDIAADKQLEVMLSSDRIIRINVDGVCAMRIRCSADCEIRFDTPIEILVMDGQLIMK